MKPNLRVAGVMLAALGLVACAGAGKQPAGTTTHGRPGSTQPASRKPALADPPVRALPLKDQGKVTSISMEKTFELQQSGEALVFDARPPWYFATGHLPGAINMPKISCDEVILKRKAELDAAKAANKPIIVYCTNFLCADARKVATHLAYQGYSSSVMSGGWDAWKESGLPTE